MLLNTTLDDISAVIGFTPTMAIAERYGGQHLYIPEAVKPDHPLTALIGTAAMRALVKAWRRQSLFIPMNTAVERIARNQAICERLSTGQGTRQLASEFGLSLRRIEQLRARLVVVRVVEERALPPAPGR